MNNNENQYNPFGNSVNNNSYYIPPNVDPRQSFNKFNNENYLKQKMEQKEIRRFGNSIGLAVLAYIIMQFIAVKVISVAGLMDAYYSNSAFQSAFGMLGVSVMCVAVPFGIMALINKKRYVVPIVPTEKVGFLKSCAFIAAGMGCCIVANFIVSFLMQLVNLFGYQLTKSESLDPSSAFDCLVFALATAVMPAICEEFAMRCCSMQLLRKYGSGFAVFSISIVFGLLHGNVIQFVFAFFVGLTLGFVTIKTKSIVPAILIHCFNNALSVVQSIFKYTSGELVANNITSAIYVFWLVCALIAVIYLFRSGNMKFCCQKEEYEHHKLPESSLSLGKKLVSFFFVPGMIIPFIYLIFATITTIEKI